MEPHDAFLQVHEHFGAVFNFVDGLPELICISFNVNLANPLVTLTLLTYIFHLIFDHRYTFHSNAYNLFFREQSKKKIGRQMELAGSNLTEDQLEDMLEQGQGAQLVGHVHIEGDADQLRQTINDIENRHEMFMNLEKSITELHDMFIDIATLIESQGEMVNRIDAHVDSAVEYTTRATNDTKKALEYQSKARRKKIMMMLCIIIGGGLAIWIGGKKLELF